MVEFADLRIERPKVVEETDAEEAHCGEIQNRCYPFAQVKSMNSENAEEREQNPCDRVVQLAGIVTAGRVSVHGRNQESIDQPADTKESQGEEPDRAGDRLAEIESVGTCESENPQDIPNDFAVRVGFWLHFK